MKTTRPESIDSDILKWGSVALLAFLLGSFVGEIVDAPAAAATSAAPARVTACKTTSAPSCS